MFLDFFVRSGYDRAYNGTIIVTKEEDKTLYSLELYEYPEMIQFQNELVLQGGSSE